MFSRIRYAVKVLSYSAPKVNPSYEPDITFEEESPQQVNRISRVIGSVIEILLVSFFIGLTVGRNLYRLLPTQTTVSLLTLTGITAALFSGIIGRMVESLNARIRLQLKIGERIAPYFGHKITKAVHILRG